MIKNIVLFFSIILVSGLLLTNIYNSIVDARSWGNNLPESIQTARNYYSAVNPGTFFRVFSPLSQILALVALILFWKAVPSVRLYLGAALLLYVLTDAFTFGYFYPRNAIMFEGAMNMDSIRNAWSQWNSMNWLRSFILLTGLFFSCLSLHKVYMKNLQEAL